MTTTGQAPQGVGGRVQYGPGVLAHAANLTCANHVPVTALPEIGSGAHLVMETTPSR